jgi:hypothetical protein
MLTQGYAIIRLYSFQEHCRPEVISSFTLKALIYLAFSITCNVQYESSVTFLSMSPQHH